MKIFERLVQGDNRRRFLSFERSACIKAISPRLISAPRVWLDLIGIGSGDALPSNDQNANRHRVVYAAISQWVSAKP